MLATIVESVLRVFANQLVRVLMLIMTWHKHDAGHLEQLFNETSWLFKGELSQCSSLGSHSKVVVLSSF